MRAVRIVTKVADQRDGHTLPIMLQRLHNMPDGTVGFRIDGDVEDEDYEEILVPALKAALEAARGCGPSI